MQDTFDIRNRDSLDTRDAKMPPELLKAFYDLDIESVLDIGCGTGWLCDYIPLRTTYYGFDPDKERIEQAKKLHPKGEFLNFTIKQFLEFAELSKFDVAFLKCIFCVVEPNPTLDVIEVIKRHVQRFIFLYDTERETDYWNKPFIEAGFQLIFEHFRQSSRVQIWRVKHE